MSLEHEKTLEENEQYSFALIERKNTMLFIWEYVEGLSIHDFRDGILAFAAQCKKTMPDRVVIDAASLDPSSPAVGWLRGDDSDTYLNYGEWWAREIVPIYHEAGIDRLAVGTGDPNAPGELENSPPGVNFKIGYFSDIEAALAW
jgi:hypothetical protein